MVEKFYLSSLVANSYGLQPFHPKCDKFERSSFPKIDI